MGEYSYNEAQVCGDGKIEQVGSEQARREEEDFEVFDFTRLGIKASDHIVS